MKDIIDVRGASGAVYRFTRFRDGNPLSAMGGNFIYAREANAQTHLLYAGEAQNLYTSSDPRLSIYARVKTGEEETWAPVACTDLKLGAELFSPKDEGLQGRCQFAANYRAVMNKENEASNLDVDLTGVYFVGPLGAQILVLN